MIPPCTFETPPPSRVATSYFEMTGLEILAYHSRRLGRLTPSYWPHVILQRDQDNKQAGKKSNRK